MATFALSRFREVEGTDATFRRVPDFDANVYARETFGITRGEKIREGVARQSGVEEVTTTDGSKPSGSGPP